MYEIQPLLKDDIAICTNYIYDEYEAISGSKTTKDVSHYMRKVIEGSTGYKVVDETGKLVAFYAYELDDKNNALITTFLVADGYRKSEPFYLLVKHMKEELWSSDTIVYIPIDENMNLIKSICVDGTIDKNRYEKELAVMARRWE